MRRNLPAQIRPDYQTLALKIVAQLFPNGRIIESEKGLEIEIPDTRPRALSGWASVAFIGRHPRMLQVKIIVGKNYQNLFKEFALASSLSLVDVIEINSSHLGDL